jgi:hypothetical protein
MSGSEARGCDAARSGAQDMGAIDGEEIEEA